MQKGGTQRVPPAARTRERGQLGSATRLLPCGSVRFVRRHPVLSTIALLLVAVLGLFVATGYAVWRAAHTDDARRVQHADTILVLGAAQYNGRPSPVFQARLSHAELLFHEGFASKVLVVGGNKPGDATTEAAAGRSWLVGPGVPTE